MADVTKESSREEINAAAREAGIENPEDYRNKDELLAAIAAAEAGEPIPEPTPTELRQPQARQAERPPQPQARQAERPPQPKTTYIVNGVEVDPNGVPVKKG